MIQRCYLTVTCLLFVLACGTSCAAQAPAQRVAAAPAPDTRPNILFIAVDDLNDWIGCLGGHPQSVTPNFDRLAASGVLFTNAHCPAPSCNPSRSAIMTGIAPNVSGMYRNQQDMRHVLPDAPIMPRYFADRAGYNAIGSGKMLHYFIDAPSWDDYYPDKETENPFPPTMQPPSRPVSLPRAGDWQYYETDWGPIDATDEEYGGDYRVTQWVGDQLGREHDQPFFLCCGLYRPHEPWFVPVAHFDAFPIEDIQLPPGYLADDLADLPAEGQRLGPNRYFDHIQNEGQWKQGVQGYLASIRYADAMLGHVLDALDNGPNADNTIVVLWSDHGWHLGEKEHWQKYTGWRACTRVPLMVRVPAGISTLATGTAAGTVCDEPVSLLSLFPTLTELAGIEHKDDNDAPSIVPLLRYGAASAGEPWDHVAVTYLDRPGSYSISDNDYRYIHYADGGEELYYIPDDPYEWNNLADNPEHAGRLAALRAMGPTEFAPMPPEPEPAADAPEIDPDATLTFIPATREDPPASEPEGEPFRIRFINRTDIPVVMHWIDRDGVLQPYATIPPGRQQRQSTRIGAAWQIQTEDGTPLGHFVVDAHAGQAVVPADANE
ncbi:sulfatase-like hydrolase/transferase [Phycisphaeraceae bacterium D3-23]